MLFPFHIPCSFGKRIGSFYENRPSFHFLEKNMDSKQIACIIVYTNQTTNNMENQKFPFSSPGVQDWKNKLYASSEEEIEREQELIYEDTPVWLVRRFELDNLQVAFMNSLGENSLECIGFDINEAIKNRADIRMQREEPQPGRDNSKVATSSKSYHPKTAKHNESNSSIVVLDIRFYYTDNPL